MLSQNPMTLSVIELSEASKTIGREIKFNYRHLPKDVLEHIYDVAEKKGIEKGQVNMLLHNPTHSIGEGEIGDRTSLAGMDVIDGAIQHAIEAYDKATDEAILASDDIVRTYNAAIDAHFEKALEYAKRIKTTNLTKAKWMGFNSGNSGTKIETKQTIAREAMDSGHFGAANMIGMVLRALEPLELNDSEKKKIICEAAYQPSDNPDEIRAIIEARMKYNDLIITLLKEMLRVNYQFLGMTKDKALILTKQLESENQNERRQSIKDIKKAFSDNVDQFRKGSTIVDCRPIGCGVFFGTDEEVGIFVEEADKADRILQLLMRYDAVVSCHGGDSSKDFQRVATNIYERMAADNAKERKRLSDEQRRLESMMRDDTGALDALKDDAKLLSRFANRYRWAIRDYERELIDLRNDYSSEYLDLKSRVRSRQRDYDNLSERLEEAVKNMKSADEGNTKKLNPFGPLSSYDTDPESLKKRLATYKASLEEATEDLRKYEADRNKQIKALEKHIRECKKRIIEYNSKADKDMTPEQRERAIKELEKRCEAEFKRITDIKIRVKKTGGFRNDADADKQSFRLANKHVTDGRWTIQKVKTLSGGPFTDLNDLVRQLIKEGFKNILITACNPGGHRLDADIRQNKSVMVSFSKTSLLVENAGIPEQHDDDNGLFAETYATLAESEEHLVSMCESIGVDYYNDQQLTSYCTDVPIYELNEGTLSNIWSRIVELVKKAIGFLANLFKKIIELVKRVIAKIVNFFKTAMDKLGVKRQMFTEKVVAGRILVESAKTDKVTTSGWEDLKRSTVSACESISKKIAMLERKQLDNMKQIERFSESKAKSIHEAANPDMENLMGLIMA